MEEEAVNACWKDNSEDLLNFDSVLDVNDLSCHQTVTYSGQPNCCSWLTNCVAAFPLRDAALTSLRPVSLLLASDLNRVHVTSGAADVCANEPARSLTAVAKICIPSAANRSLHLCRTRLLRRLWQRINLSQTSQALTAESPSLCAFCSSYVFFRTPASLWHETIW